MSAATTLPDSRTRLLDAAMQVIRAQGYSATTVDDICSRRRPHQGRVLPSLQEQGRSRGRRGGAFFANGGAALRRRALSRARGSVGSPARLCRFPHRDPRRADPGIHLSPRHDGAGGLRDASRDPPRLRHLYRRARGRGGQGHRSGEGALRAAAEWSAESLALYTQAVLQGAFVLAKAKDGPEVARDCVAHLRRYLLQLFHRPTNKEE